MPGKGQNPHMVRQRELDKVTPCYELHCDALHREHFYGDPGNLKAGLPPCSWVLRMGSVVGRSEFGKGAAATAAMKRRKAGEK